MNSFQFREIYPTNWHLMLFIVYVLLYIFQGLLIKLSLKLDAKSNANYYNYNTESAVFITELLKLLISAAIYFKACQFKTFWRDLARTKWLIVMYFVPSILYCIYNNLTYVNLTNYDPTTYYILLQFRIVITGLLFQILFKKYLTKLQWCSMILLTVGCIFKQIPSFQWSTLTPRSFGGHFLLIIVQIFLSCFAGVYTEYLLKSQPEQDNVHIMLQNILMYLDSLLCMMMIFLIKDHQLNLANMFDVRIFQSFWIIMIIFNNALCGLATSLFLKNFNSIMKSYASGIELILTALISYELFNTAIDLFTLVSILIVSYATYLYARKPMIECKPHLKQQQQQHLTNHNNLSHTNNNKHHHHQYEKISIT